MPPILDQPPIRENRNAKTALIYLLTGIGLLLISFFGGAYFASIGLVADHLVFVLVLLVLIIFLLFLLGFISAVKAYRAGEEPKVLVYMGLIGNGFIIAFWLLVLIINFLDVLRVFR
ncbi:hypothetical protein [Flavilitoribacter nigricans]|uniref:Uncharacterized protein n=1 Tax=Flavilitoribacter nigricans (strain ATCC 23147 / DSM 23189 / NBRC 102662 / NCIMB 1420 / SS-2) TaxID=1122177 RepID=A0A2D0N1T5_FLAN2|nr:hypothetical protein [Flavilitoribacter nigricans]PHN02474.1 hypothetical protein CRP01_31320 [Flavilitoribacter nigricans DSM 23189 = NBRC 102662]